MGAKGSGNAAEYITEALFLLMHKKEYADISISELCQKAGVTRMSFYRNFGSKEEVLKKWIGKITDDFLISSNISYKNDPTEVYFVKLFTHLLEHKEICIVLHRAGLLHLIQGEFERIIFSQYKDVYDNYKSCFLAGGIFHVFLFWVRNGCRETPEQMAKKMVGFTEK